MICPKCQSKEIDSSGFCLVCGYKAEENPPAQFRQNPDENFMGMIEMNYSATPEQEDTPKPELPQWRIDLARRLQEIKQKRELTRKVDPSPQDPPPAEPVKAGERAAPAPQPVSRPAQIRPRKPPRVVKSPPVGAEGVQDRGKPPFQEATLPLFDAARARTETVSYAAANSSAEIKNLIDTAVARQPASARHSPPQDVQPRAQRRSYTRLEPLESKLILLSRTLSGLIDLIIVIFCAGSFILAADLFGGIDVIDTVSLLDYGLLVLATYFVYSIFFLASAGQTIGMMITELRVVGAGGRRARLGQIVWRSAAHLISLLIVIGLAWSCFDEKNRCLHDLLSGTQVVSN